MRQSPFAQKTVSPAPIMQGLAQQNPVVPVPSPASPLASSSRAVAVPRIMYTQQQIDKVGKNTMDAARVVNESVTQRMTLNRLGDIGVLLAKTQLEVNELATSREPSKIPGVDWLRSKFTDARVQLRAKFQTVDSAFKELGKSMTAHVVTLQQWEVDDDQLFNKNYATYQNLQQDYKEISGMVAHFEAVEKAWPADESQVENKLDLVQQRIILTDLLERARVRQKAIHTQLQLCEMDGPEVLLMKQASGKMVSKIETAVQIVFPAVLRRLTKEIQALDLKAATGSVNVFEESANNIMQKGAESTRDAVLEANRAFQRDSITDDTLDVMRKALADTATGLLQISTEANSQRKASIESNEQKQRDLLKTLQHTGVV